MRNLILKRINKISLEENGFSSELWKDHFVSVSYVEKSIRLSDVDYNLLSDEELINIFEYIILSRDQISSIRTIKQYFT